ncbi:hypothetical protein NLM27_34780 [Bradyrhizobium sp. CCGB12]|uniref:hypothetical protein n=1 Tax=Bradyrhizobium sp. CCGB12 TaxID=2949632 RepID=UPI0020B31D74|nr:hypothetical protein [Bradyrhizobium sp. CCGB12]MCP3393924.1 hypothetical protein [Bradyrhizobium sp. CCGB12]
MAFLTDFSTAFLAGFAAAPLRTAAFLLEVFATVFFEALFFLVVVFFATSHLLNCGAEVTDGNEACTAAFLHGALAAAANAANCQ